MISVYHNEFATDGYGNEDKASTWARVQSEFAMTDPEPAQVIFADYEYENYEGSADVFWRNADGTFGYQSGGHCSCYGLEGQWDPETFTAEQLAGQVERANYGFFKEHADVVRAALATPATSA